MDGAARNPGSSREVLSGSTKHPVAAGRKSGVDAPLVSGECVSKEETLIIVLTYCVIPRFVLVCFFFPSPFWPDRYQAKVGGCVDLAWPRHGNWNPP